MTLSAGCEGLVRYDEQMGTMMDPRHASAKRHPSQLFQVAKLTGV